jgi:hypothetical protein
MHPDCRMSYPIEFRPYFRLVRCRSCVVLDWIDLAVNYEVVLHLFIPEVDVRPVNLRNAHLR